MAGLIVGFYMAGLTLGSIMKSITGKFNLKRLYIVIQLMMALTFLILPVFAVFAVRNQSHGFLIHFLILLTTIFVSFAAGLEFNIASQLEKQTVKTASMLYAVDLTGAALGTLITSIICFPLLGLFNTCYIIAALIVGSVLLLAFRNRHLNR
jgi:predicted MFS family arabinose efflux permease